MEGRYIDLLKSLPKTKRDIKARSEAKDPEVVRIAKQFGFEYFDGDRKYGYGGYYYDGRWTSVARDIIWFFKLQEGQSVLDVGCGKGFLVKDFNEDGIHSYGIDISPYAILSSGSLRDSLMTGTAERLPMPDKSFDLVLSINTLHNLPRDGVIRALREMQRVSKGDCYVVVDSYNTPEEKEIFESWQLTALTHGYPEFWLQLFKEAGYTGHYSWNML